MNQRERTVQEQQAETAAAWQQARALKDVQPLSVLTTSGTTIGTAPQGGQTFSYSNLTSSR